MQESGGVKSFTGKFRWLSNFYPAQVRGVGNFDYPTVEHAYQAAKTTDEHQWVWFASLAMCPRPGDAKRRGQKLILRRDWDAIKLPVMEALLRQKFARGSELAAKLAEIDGEIVEGNYWGDTFWGQCGGLGFNHLGRMLMKIRDELR